MDKLLYKNKDELSEEELKIAHGSLDQLAQGFNGICLWRLHRFRMEQNPILKKFVYERIKKFNNV